MIGLSEFRKLLGPTAEGFSDAKVERIREVEYGIADAMFERWLRKRNAQVAERLEGPREAIITNESSIMPRALSVPDNSGAVRG